MKSKLAKTILVIGLCAVGMTSGSVEKSASITEVWQILPEEGNACDEEDLSFDYGLNGGMRNFFCRAMTVYSWKVFIASAPVFPFRKGPHKDGKLNLNAGREFGYYNPKFVAWATQALIPAAESPLIWESTQLVYDKQIKYLANLYFLVDQKLRVYPEWTKQERQRYLDSIEESGGAWDASEVTWAYHDFLKDDQYDPNHVRSAVMWWLRRDQDATSSLWRVGLNKLLSTYDTEWLVEQNQIAMHKKWPANPMPVPIKPDYK